MYLRWQTDDRYVSAVAERDLLGDWTVTIANGGIRNRLGAIRTHYVASETAAMRMLTALHKRRLKHKYQLVLGTPPSLLVVPE